jgi:hypothetical protein
MFDNIQHTDPARAAPRLAAVAAVVLHQQLVF